MTPPATTVIATRIDSERESAFFSKVRCARASVTGGGFPGGSPHRGLGQRPVVLDPTPRRHVAG
jgi:hypothetical protein